MISMTTYPRKPVTDAYEGSATLARAVQELLELYVSTDTPLLTVSHDYVQLSALEEWCGVKQYYGYLVFKKTDDCPPDEFVRLLWLCRAIQLLTNWGDGEASCMPTMPPAQNDYVVAIPEDRSKVTRAVAARLGAQWLLGRDIDWTGLDNPELPLALGMAVREELEGNGKAEEVLRGLLAA